MMICPYCRQTIEDHERSLMYRDSNSPLVWPVRWIGAAVLFVVLITILAAWKVYGG